MSLVNKTILVTRQREQSSEFVVEVEKRGGRAVLLPMINIQDPDSWEELDRALQHIASYDALIFTSTNSVEKFFQRCVLRMVEPVAFRKCEVYAVGEKTKLSVEERGLRVTATPSTSSSAGLAEYFGGVDIKGKRFLYPRGDLGTADLTRSLVRLGAAVDPIVVYKNVGIDEVEAGLVHTRLVNGEIDVVTFASPSAAINFVKLFPPDKIARMDKKMKVAVIGPTTADAVKKLGVRVDIVAATATVDGLLDAIEDYYAA